MNRNHRSRSTGISVHVRRNTHGQYNLGMVYEHGRGVTQDYAQAVKWYRLAAEQGLADAQYRLGSMYDEGRGVKQDYAEAAIWYRVAADKGHEDAQYNIAFAYEIGRGVTQNLALAYMWYAVAERLYLNPIEPERIALMMTPELLSQAQQMVREWFLTPVE